MADKRKTMAQSVAPAIRRQLEEMVDATEPAASKATERQTSKAGSQNRPSTKTAPLRSTNGTGSKTSTS